MSRPSMRDIACVSACLKVLIVRDAIAQNGLIWTVLNAAVLGALLAPSAAGAALPDIRTVPPDLKTPPMTDEPPAPGKRVRQVAPGYEGSGVYHALYLPTDYRRGKRYPVIVEYAGNEYHGRFGDVCTGTVEGSNLGYGISAGRGFIWICMPFVDANRRCNAKTWWGDVQATVDYCKATVRRVCRDYGGDPSAVILAGFSRGAIACNYIGLHDDEIAGLWRAFVAHSHYDGVRRWGYPEDDPASALERLRRLWGRPVFISHEGSCETVRRYIASTGVEAPFTFQAIGYRNHRDDWVLRDIPERTRLREWVRSVLTTRPAGKK
jgi:hypothetical protein